MSAARLGDDSAALFDAIELPLFAVALDGTVVWANRAARDAAGPGQPELAGRSLATLGPGQPWRQIGELLAHLREVALATALVRDRAGGGGWHVTARRYVAAGDEPRAAVMIRDLRAGPTPAAAAGPGDRMAALGALVAGVAHEVRDPLFGISATLDAFEARFGAAGEHAAYLHALREELGRLKGLMQDLLDYGHAGTVTRTPGAVEEVLAQAVRHLAPAAAAAGVTLRCEVLGGPLAPVLLDGQRLRQAIENLVTNAIQHAPPGTAVAIEARPGTVEDARAAPDTPAFWRLALEAPAAPAGPATEGRWIVCTVADAGPGFRPEDLPRVFEPFFTRRRGGTGMGLSIVERVVEAHGGYVTAALRPGGGALVTVRLPCAPA
ncbi:MAG TPA: ATP-binding protein [Polyangia bacterium]|jgi:signal transduction histidine kinase